MEGGVRELKEETIWKDKNDWKALEWYKEGTVCSTDSIGEEFHYLIAHCFAQLEKKTSRSDNGNSNNNNNDDDDGDDKRMLPGLQAADDAADANWFLMSEIEKKCKEGIATPAILAVLKRVEDLCEYGLLPTQHSN